MAPEPPPIDPLEPFFFLRGSDPCAYLAAVMWSCLRSKRGDAQGAQYGIEMAQALEAYARSHGQDADQAFADWAQLLSEGHARFQALLTSAAAERMQLGQRVQ
jgi:hypothetical protein